MITSIVSKLHWIIILYTLYTVYGMYEEHQERLEMAKSRIPVVKGQIIKANKEKLQLKDYFRDIEKAKKRIEAVAAEVEKLQRKLPADILDAENLDLLSNEAKDLNIKNVSLSPQEEVDEGFYYSKKYNLKGTGTYLQFLILLERISMVERLLNISKISLKKSKDKQKGRFQLIDVDMIVESYRYNANFKEDRGIREIEAKYSTGTEYSKKRNKKEQDE